MYRPLSTLSRTSHRHENHVISMKSPLVIRKSCVGGAEVVLVHPRAVDVVGQRFLERALQAQPSGIGVPVVQFPGVGGYQGKEEVPKVSRVAS